MKNKFIGKINKIDKIIDDFIIPIAGLVGIILLVAWLILEGIDQHATLVG